MDTIFKIGDKVFDIFYGHGEITKISHDDYHYPIRVNFFGKGIIISFTEDGRFDLNDNYPRLSFTEYDLVNGGFSQKRTIDYNEHIGKYCKFWNKDKHNIVIDRFVGYDNSRTKFFESTFDYYENFEPLTEEQLKILGLKNDY